MSNNSFPSALQCLSKQKTHHETNLASVNFFLKNEKNDWRMNLSITQSMTWEAKSATSSDQAECKLIKHP